MSSSKNLEYQKNSFLSKANSAFIESMYLRYIKKDPNLPQSWQKYFKSLNQLNEIFLMFCAFLYSPFCPFYITEKNERVFCNWQPDL